MWWDPPADGRLGKEGEWRKEQTEDRIDVHHTDQWSNYTEESKLEERRDHLSVDHVSIPGSIKRQVAQTTYSSFFLTTPHFDIWVLLLSPDAMKLKATQINTVLKNSDKL